ncbi:HAD family phosphatase [bacterium]|nr:HAD family phosphatase [bacterium]
MIKIEKNIKALIFDCDGTLVDSMPLQFEAWRETFELFGYVYPHEFIDSRKGMSIAEVLRQYNDENNYTIDMDKFIKIREEKAIERLYTVKPIKPVTDIVHRYNGVLPMAICSGSGIKSVMVSLKTIGLTEQFNEVITADDNLPPKPAADIFLEAARRLNVHPSQCQVFEDGDSGIEAAIKAGMTVTDIRNHLENE